MHVVLLASLELLANPTGRTRNMLSCPECDAVLDVAEKELEEGGTISCENAAPTW